MRTRFVRTGRAAEGVKAIPSKTSGNTPEVGAAEKDGQSVNRDQPKRERLEAGVRFSLFPLNGGVHLLDVLGFTVVHPLPDPAFGSGIVLVHFASFAGAGAGEVAAAGGEAGAAAVIFNSFKAWDWSSDIRYATRHLAS